MSWPGSVPAFSALWACATSPAGWRSAPSPIDREEAEQVWSWIRQVGPDDAVMADYEVSAPLSSRRRIYSYVLDANLPTGLSRARSRVSLALHPQRKPFL